ncbi:XXYS1_4_G0037310.mRNA.1.CDS.1 [Saccharomyces cerevisiae]|nr:XXYS1_4_G0037310.mRNA.1.CDS.1 [Saccharomyces cerevisiae]
MDSYSITNVKYLDPTELHRWMQEGYTTTLREPFQVVDVRGSDYMGGHIKDGWHYAYSRLKQDAEYLRELKHRLLQKQADGRGALNVIFHCMLSQQRGPSAAMLLLRSLDTAELSRCRLWVLRGGFSRWQSVYGDDESVTAGYLPDLWR